MIFSVWAPAATSVDLVLGTGAVTLAKGAGGYWAVDLDAERAARGYAYSIDGGPEVPDPRSRWQPEGVHGRSYVVDPESLRELQQPGFKARPLRAAIIYELHVGTFSPEGTYEGAERKLRHLVDLGITHVELMPLATFPGGRGWGYDGVHLYAPLAQYGTPQSLARFVAACHRLGLAVLLDVVYNHLGPDGNYLGHFGPYFTDRVKTPWGEAMNYDGPQSDAVRSFAVDNALMWLEDYGFDGLRLDAVHAIYSFEAVHLLEDLAAAVRSLGSKLNRPLVLIAESDLNDPILVRPPARGGFGLDAHWADDFHHAVHRHFTGDASGYYADFHGLEDVATALSKGYVYQGQYSEHRQRRHGRAPLGVRADQLVVCAQNHDQVGNRAQGERLSMLLNDAQLQAVAALVLLSPFVPMLFQGEEWGAGTPFIYFTDHQDAELGKLVTQGRTNEFKAFAWTGAVPDPQAADSFERSKLDWTELDQTRHAQLYQWHRSLIKLRHGALGGPGTARAAVKFDAARGWLRFSCGGILAAFNFSSKPQRVPTGSGDWSLVLSSVAGDIDPSQPLPADGTRIFARRDAALHAAGADAASEAGMESVNG